MKIRAGLIGDLEKCGLAAALATSNPETSEGAERARLIRTEVKRAFHVGDQATLPEAEAALAFVRSEPADLRAVGEVFDLVEPETGEVLVTGSPGAVLVGGGDVVRVIAWKRQEQHDMPEPDDDLGLQAMAIAAGKGAAFQVVYGVFMPGEQRISPRRSHVFSAEEIPAIMARIVAATQRKPIACPGDWCGACRVRYYCPAWKARAEAAMLAFPRDADGNLQLELTNQNAGQVYGNAKTLEEVAELAKNLVKAHVRKGGACTANGKYLYLGSDDGRETVSVDALRSLGGQLALIGIDVESLIKKGKPFERPTWRKVDAPVASGTRVNKKPAAVLVGKE